MSNLDPACSREARRAPGGRRKEMRVSLAIAVAVFPVIFIGELPDKTMMASLVMATRGKPFFVWMGAAMAFLVHVVIATTIGVALFRVLPSRVLDAVVAVMFVVGGVYALREGTTDEEALIDREVASHTVVTTAFLVIFVAEWGDLTQILTANLAAHYHSGLSVGLGAVTALWAVAALAVLGGQGLLRYVNVATVRKITAGVLFVFAAVAVFQAVR
jgi:putative Ca2+/H+ antiporter (TMEM165/GDT1 family)